MTELEEEMLDAINENPELLGDALIKAEELDNGLFISYITLTDRILALNSMKQMTSKEVEEHAEAQEDWAYLTNEIKEAHAVRMAEEAANNAMQAACEAKGMGSSPQPWPGD